MTLTFMPHPSKSPRQEIVDEIRKNLFFLHENGPKSSYSFERLAIQINLKLGTNFDKGDARRLITGENKVSSASLPDLGSLLSFSRSERAKMENTLAGIFNAVVVSVPVSPELSKALDAHPDVFGTLGRDAVLSLRRAVKKFDCEG